MAGRLYRMAKVVSANPASWGIVDANQISGFRTVATQADLYSIAACILSSSYGDGTTTGADAVGQIWHVQEGNGGEGKDFRLINWSKRGSAEGWIEEIASAKLSSGIVNATAAAKEAKELATTANNTANAAKSQATTNAAAIAGKADTSRVNELSTKVNDIETTVSGHTTDIAQLKPLVEADHKKINEHTKQLDKKADLDEGGNVPLDQLGNLDTTLFEVLTGDLPNTIAKIKKHIYLKTAETTGEKNNYAEYVYTGGIDPEKDTYDATKWEKLGEVTASVDLSGYYTKTQTDSQINKHRINTIGFVPAASGTDLQLKLTEYQGEVVGPTTIPLVSNTADNSRNGLMSPTMLTKLNGLNNYTHPEHTAHTSGLYKITVDDLGHVSATANVEAKDLKAAGALTSAPAFELGSAVHPDKITINASYNGTNHPVDIAEADSKHPGLISPALYDKLTGITVNDTVTSTGTDAVSGKAVWNHVYNYKIHGDNVGNEVNGTSYTIVARSDDDNTVTCLTDVLTLNYDATNHSNLVVDSAVVWDEDNLKAISNDRLTEILV